MIQRTKLTGQWSAAFEVISRHYAPWLKVHATFAVVGRGISVNRWTHAAVSMCAYVCVVGYEGWRRSTQFTGNIIISRGLVLLIIPHNQRVARAYANVQSEMHELLSAVWIPTSGFVHTRVSRWPRTDQRESSTVLV